MSIRENISTEYLEDFWQVPFSLRQIMGIALQLDTFKAEKVTEKELINLIFFIALTTFVWRE